jgi:site-specific recombinase XerD
LLSEVKLTAALSNLFDQVRAGPAAEALVPWVCDVLPSLHSRQAYFNDLQMFFLRMREQGVSPFEVTGDHVRIYKEVLQGCEKRPATIARALSVIRGTYEQFGKKKLIPWNVVGDIHAVTSPRVEKNTTPALSEAEAKKLLHAPDVTTLQGLRDHAMLFTYFITACRCSALLKARVGDIERTDNRFYLVVHEKGGKTQRKALLEADGPLLQWLESSGLIADPLAPLFPAIGRDRQTLLPKPLTRDAVRKLIKRYCVSAGIDPHRLGRRGIGVHSLRKTAITNALEHGAKMEQVQQLAGHSDIRTTQLYYQSRERDAEDAARHIQIR